MRRKRSGWDPNTRNRCYGPSDFQDLPSAQLRPRGPAVVRRGDVLVFAEPARRNGARSAGLGRGRPALEELDVAHRGDELTRAIGPVRFSEAELAGEGDHAPLAKVLRGSPPGGAPLGDVQEHRVAATVPRGDAKLTRLKGSAVLARHLAQLGSRVSRPVRLTPIIGPPYVELPRRRT